MNPLEHSAKTPTETAAVLRQFNKWLRGNKDGPQLESREINRAIDAAIEMIERLEAAERERDALRARIEAMERQEPLDAGSDVFRSAFEATPKAGNWPATRQGDGYRSPSTQIAWGIAFSTVNRLKLYIAPGAKGE